MKARVKSSQAVRVKGLRRKVKVVLVAELGPSTLGRTDAATTRPVLMNGLLKSITRIRREVIVNGPAASDTSWRRETEPLAQPVPRNPSGLYVFLRLLRFL